MMPDRIDRVFAGVDNKDFANMAIVEALRLIADSNKGINEGLKGIQEEVRDIRERVIKIEAAEFKTDLARVQGRIDGVIDRVDVLESDKDRRDGALNLTNWVLRNWPAVLGYIVLAGIVLFANGKFLP